MKRIIFVWSVCLVLSAVFTRAYAQAPSGTYFVETTLVSLQNTGHNAENITLDVRVDREGNSSMFGYGTGRIDPDRWGSNLPRTDNVTYSTRPSKLILESHRHWRNYVPFKWKHHDDRYINALTIDRTSPYIVKRRITRADNNSDIVAGGKATFEYTIQPTAIKFYTSNGREIRDALTVKYDSDISIHATRGYVGSLYNWVYSLDNGGSWIQIPTNLLNGSKDAATFSGADLFPNFKDFIDFLDKGNKIWVKLNIDTSATRERHDHIVLLPLHSAPNFVNKPEIVGYTDGMADVRLTFDRELFEGELINIGRRAEGESDGLFSPEDANLALDVDNSVVLSGVGPGLTEFTVISILNLPGGGAYESNDDPPHTTSIDVDARTEIMHDLRDYKNVSTPGGNDGEITIQAFGGNGTFTAGLYKDGSTTPLQKIPFAQAEDCVFTGLSAGEYRIEVSDTDGIKSSNVVEVEITEPSMSGITYRIVGHRNVSSFGGSDGQITIRAEGGTDTFTAEVYKDGSSYPVHRISFNGGEDGVFPDLSAGVYEVRLSDSSGASVNFNVMITQPAMPGITCRIIESKNVSTGGGSDGEITIRASGGSGNFSAVLYRNGSGDPIRQVYFGTGEDGVFSDLPAGIYEVRVSDSNGLSSNVNVTISEPTSPDIRHKIIDSKNISCHGGSDGQITVSASGGSGKLTASLYVEEIDSPVQRISFNSGGNCVFSGLTAGVHEVRVSDSRGNTSGDKAVITISEPYAPVSASVVETIEPLAFESRDGEAVIVVKGGTPDYTAILSDLEDITYSPSSSFKDSNGAMFYRFEGLGRGDYSVTVQDANFSSVDPEYQVLPCSCEAIITFTLNAPPPMIVEIEETASIMWHGATQGELTAHGTGGVPISSDKPYTYIWYKREGGVMQPLPIPGDSIASGLSAGVYQVKITDKNGVSKTSVTYTLEEPMPLTVQFTIVQTDCSGASSGSIEAFVSGGVPPYQYQWNIEGAAERKVMSLEAGTYMLKVTDSKGGILTSTVDVGSASDLKVEQTVTQPSCLTPGGSIRLKLSGAAPPYSIRWNDMSDASNVDSEGDVAREGLAPGTYKVEIADAKGCRNSLSFTIDEIETFEVSLGDDLVMCRNQSRTVEAVCGAPDVSYEWFLNGTKLPDTGRSIIVDKNGEYGVVASTADGCVAMDQINVEITDDVLDLLMTVPTTIEAGSQIYAVNLSTMAADKINWILPDEATIMESSDTRLVFRIDTEGTYTIAMEGFKGAGASLVTREIEVVGAGKVELPDSPLIKQFWASPNPSTGYFKVMVELSRAEDFKMTLYSPSGVAVDTKEAKGVESRSYEYEIAGIQQGTYLLHLEAKAEKSVLKVEIKR